MKNRDKFAKEIMDIACAGGSIAFDKKANKLTSCQGMRCRECAFCLEGNEGCNSKIKEWCNSEYEEPEVDWSKVPVDTPILVRDIITQRWMNRYFAKFENGRVYTWMNGSTSFSAENKAATSPWGYAKLANESQQKVEEVLKTSNCKIRVNEKTILDNMRIILDLMKKAYITCPSSGSNTSNNICEAIGKIETLIHILSE